MSSKWISPIPVKVQSRKEQSLEDNECVTLLELNSLSLILDPELELVQEEIYEEKKEEKHHWTSGGEKTFKSFLEKYGTREFLTALFVSALQEDEEYDYADKELPASLCHQFVMHKIGQTHEFEIDESRATLMFTTLVARRCYMAFPETPSYLDGYFIGLVAKAAACPFGAASVICLHIRRNRAGEFLNEAVCLSQDVDESLVKSFNPREVKEFFGPRKGSFLLRLALACCYAYSKDFPGSEDVYGDFASHLKLGVSALDRSYFGILL